MQAGERRRQRLRLGRALCLAAALLLCGLPLAPSAPAEPLRLSIEESRGVAAHLLESGQPSAAAAIARTLLQRDPKDFAALLILSRAELALGSHRAAAGAGRDAFRAAESKEEHFIAARTTAAALSRQGAMTRAQLWLRMASQHAPDDVTRQMAAYDFKTVRSQNPWSYRFAGSIQPSSNINNGSKNDTMNIGGLDFLLSGDARALSGLEYRFGFDTLYRIRPSETQSMRFGLSFDSRDYTLSEEARKQAPDATGSDYAFRSLELKAGMALRNEAAGHSTDFSLGVGQNWYAGDPLTVFVKGEVARRFALGNGRRATLKFGLEQQWRKDSPSRNAWIVSAKAAHSWSFDNDNWLRLSLEVRDTTSDSAAVAHTSAVAGIRYGLAKPLFGAGVSLWADVGGALYKEPYLLNDPREDVRAALGASLFFRDISYYGFAPSLDVSYSITESSLNLNDTEKFGISLGIRSAF